MEKLSNLTKKEYDYLEKALEEFRKNKKLEYENSYSEITFDMDKKYEEVFDIIESHIDEYIKENGFTTGYTECYRIGNFAQNKPYFPSIDNTNNCLLENLTQDESEYISTLISDINNKYIKKSIKLKNKYIDEIKNRKINTREYFNYILEKIYKKYIEMSRVVIRENNNLDIIEEKENIELTKDDKRKIDSLNEITVENGSTEHEEKIAKKKIQNIISKKENSISNEEELEKENNEDDFNIIIYGDDKTYIIPSKLSRFMDNCSGTDELGRWYYWSYYTRIDSSVIHLQDSYYNDSLKEEKEIIEGLRKIKNFLSQIHSKTIKVKYYNVTEEENTKDFIDIIELHLGIATKIKINYDKFINHQNDFSKVIIKYNNREEMLLTPFHLELYLNDETNQFQVSSDDPELKSEIKNYEYNRVLKDNEIVYVDRAYDVVYIKIVRN